MLYRVLLNGTDILDYSDPELVLLSPQATIELDTSGSFEFTVPPTHRYYNLFDMSNIMALTIEIYEDNVQHFFGRPIELHLDFYKNKKVYCEGAMGYFNDSIQRKKEYDEDTYLSAFFADVISRHNEMVPASRQFTIDIMTVPDHTIYRKVDYEQTADVLKSKLLDAEDAHFFIEKRNGVNYISFLKDDTMPYSCNQMVQFAENLLNFSYSFDGKDFATCVLPLGAVISEEDGGNGEALTIASVNNGSDILVGNAATNFGQIVKVEHYSDIKDPSELMSEGQKYLRKIQYNATLIECSAVDMHSKDNTKTPFRVGQTVHCISVPHGIELDLPLSKLTLYLDSAAKQITLGRIPKKTLSRFYKEEVRGSTGKEDEDETSGWDIVPPDTDGGTPTMKKMPVGFVVTELPYQKSYADGETIDYTGMICYAVSSFDPVEYFTDSSYPTGQIPLSEIITPVTIMPTAASQKTSSVQILVRWENPYKSGQMFNQIITLTNSTKKAQEDAAIAAHGGAYPDHIEAYVTKLGGIDPQVYKDGQYIHKNGVKVYAFWPDGSRYTDNGYSDGYIPSTEWTFSPAIASMADAEIIYDVDTPYGNIQVVEIDNGTVINGNIEGRTKTLVSHAKPVYAVKYYDWYPGYERYEIVLLCSRGDFMTLYVSENGQIRRYEGASVYIGVAQTTIQALKGSNGFPLWPNGESLNGRSLADAILNNIDEDDKKEATANVTVSWKAPNDAILTTTYPIVVRPSQQ